jgi:dTDP-4-amino-4,6-dideoxygalactose transaminase
MLTAISRYGARVLPDTQQLIARLAARDELVRGPHIAAFERAFADRLGLPCAVATSYGRMAFLYILRALDLPAGGEIVVPALTFWVVPEMARVAGLTPVFADVDPATFNMTAASLERAISPRTVAVVPTHLWGLPCDMDDILAVATRHGLRVVEDCAHALGATYRGRPAGTFGDAAFFSFQTFKPLNSYGGGMAVTADPALAGRVAALAAAEPEPNLDVVRTRLWHGRVTRIAIRPRVFTWSLFPILWAASLAGANPDVYLWEPIRRLDPVPAAWRERYSNVQAAIALEGLRYLDDWTRKTRAHAARIGDALARTPGVRLPSAPADRAHVFYQYCMYVASRDAFVRRCLRHGIDLETLHVDVCPELPIFAGCRGESHGARLTQEVVQVPVYESLDDASIDRIARVLRDVADAEAATGVAQTTAP